MQLIVFLERIKRVAAGGDNEVRELLTLRTWDPRLHPAWLVFEVVNELQIRPVQVSLSAFPVSLLCSPSRSLS